MKIDADKITKGADRFKKAYGVGVNLYVHDLAMKSDYYTNTVKTNDAVKKILDEKRGEKYGSKRRLRWAASDGLVDDDDDDVELTVPLV